MNMQQLMKVTLLTVIIMTVFTMLLSPDRGATTVESVSYTDFLAEVRTGSVSEVTLSGNEIRGQRADGEVFSTYAPDDPGLIGDLLDSDIRVTATPPRQPSVVGQLLLSAFPILLLIGVWVYFMRRQLGGNAGGPLGLGKSKARQFEGGTVDVRLSDVAGVDEAKEEVGELVEFLRDPSRYRKLGGLIPRGIMMVGPPGTGKTLLARAIAGEAGVPFFTVSGSDFVEMFVGVGASRVRDLFAQAKRSAPCIIFVDEIDAVGRRRGAGLGGGHDEREQTLNQMLVEMDGFEGNEGVIVMAATNRPDVLDPALLRPGRFDRQVVVQLPDLNGRAQVLRLHMRKLPHVIDVDPTVIARGTPGFSGADLANLVNEAALLAARSGSEDVTMEAFERAKDKILMGPERRNLAMSRDERRLTAYHESGHAIVGRLVPEHDPVHKVTILPRGRALGVTLFLPEQDRYSASKRRLESQIASLFGGRVAEEIVFGADAVTTGAQNDIERATRLARDMVTRWGLSDSLGPVAFEDEGEEVFLGRSVTQSKGLSESTAASIDAEVRGIIERNYDRARALLLANRETLDRMAEALLRHETLDAEQIDRLMRGETLDTGGADAGGRDEGPTPDLKTSGPAATAPIVYGHPAEQN